MDSDLGSWMPAVVNKIEYKDAADSRPGDSPVPYYELKLTHSEEVVETVGNFLRRDITLLIKTVYCTGEKVEFCDDASGENVWVKAIVKKVEYTEVSDSDNREVPCYDLELLNGNEDILGAPGDRLRRTNDSPSNIADLTSKIYKEGQNVEVYDKRISDLVGWVAAVVITMENKALSETDSRQVPHYQLKLTEDEDIIEDVLANLIRQDITALLATLYEKDEKVEFYEGDAGKGTWVPATVKNVNFKQISEFQDREVPCYDLELAGSNDNILDALGNRLRRPGDATSTAASPQDVGVSDAADITPLTDTVYHVGEQVLFFDDDTAKGEAAEITKVEYKPMSDVDNRTVPFYNLKLTGTSTLISDAAATQLSRPATSATATTNTTDSNAKSPKQADLETTYDEGLEVEFFEEQNGKWVAAEVSKVEYKVLGEAGTEEVARYELELANGNLVTDVSGDKIRSNEFKVGEKVEYLRDTVAGEDVWVKATIEQLSYKSTDYSPHPTVPHYRLKLADNKHGVQWIEDAVESKLRWDITLLVSPVYNIGDKLQFCVEDDAGNKTWVPAVVKKFEHKTLCEGDSRRVPHYKLDLGDEFVDDVCNDAVRHDITPLLDPAYAPGDEVEYFDKSVDEGVWLAAIVTQVGYLAISASDQTQVPHYRLKLTEGEGSIDDAFGDQMRYLHQASKQSDQSPLASPSKRANGNHPDSEAVDATFGITAEELLNLELDNEDVFIAGDRVEVRCEYGWIPGVVSAVTPSESSPFYSVNYDDMSTEDGIEESRVQGLYTQLGCRVVIHHDDDTGDTSWGVVVDWDKLENEEAEDVVDWNQLENEVAEEGSYRYHILTDLDAPFEVVSHPNAMMPLRHIFDVYDIVEVEVQHVDETGAQSMSWQRATVEHVDIATMTYTLEIGHKSWPAVKGELIRPVFAVGGFVQVLLHRITDEKYEGKPAWVPGVVCSIKKVLYVSDGNEGYMYKYSVLRLDTHAKSDTGPNVITVNLNASNSTESSRIMSSCHACFREYYVAIHPHSRSLASTGEHARLVDELGSGLSPARASRSTALEPKHT